MRCHDNNGQPFEIETGREEDISRLMEMYAAFQPRGHYQGLPPLNLEMCRSWIMRLFKIGENFLAWQDRRIIGHAALLPDLKLLDGEYLVFMHQQHRGRGIGTMLTHYALERAKHLKLQQIWLTVDVNNYIAIRLYRKCGFQFSGPADFEGERKMVCPTGCNIPIKHPPPPDPDPEED